MGSWESSFDRIGGNDDGLSGNFGALYPDGNEFVVFDMAGPGVINRIHYAFRSTPGLPAHIIIPTAEDYEVRFYFDDEPTPRIAMPIREFVSGTRAPFLAPATGDDIVSPGGPYVYVPIPFEKRVKITTTELGYYFQINYCLFDEDTQIQSFQNADPHVADLNALLSRPGTDPSGAVAVSELATGSFQIPANTAQDVYEGQYAGWLTYLELRPDAAAIQELSSTTLRITFDGEAAPSVDCPIDLFFGSEFGEGEVQSLLFSMTAGGPYRCYWPMPFDQDVRVSLYNQSAGTVAYDVVVGYLPVPYGGTYGRFTARSVLQETPPLMTWPTLQDYIVFDEVGRGHLVGLTLSVGSDGLNGMPQPRTYLEGDEHVWIDGLRTPAQHGTGTEEIFNWGWYSAPFAVPFTTPLHGFSRRFVEGIRDHSCSWRLYLGDLIPFRSSLRFGVEQGAEGFEGARYNAVAYVYLDPQTALVQTDEFDVGDLASEAVHSYTSSGGLLTPNLVSQIETQRLEPDLIDSGRFETTSHSFRVQVDPANQGVLLRRLHDQGTVVFARQDADVFVDGVLVRTWRNARWNVWRRFLEDEFKIPASLTAGKSELEIRIEPQGTGWNAYQYRVLSLIAP